MQNKNIYAYILYIRVYVLFRVYIICLKISQGSKCIKGVKKKGIKKVKEYNYLIHKTRKYTATEYGEGKKGKTQLKLNKNIERRLEKLNNR